MIEHRDNCYTCSKYELIRFSSFRGLQTTYAILCGAWMSEPMKRFCSYRCLMEDLATWIAANEPVEREPLAQRAEWIRFTASCLPVL